MAHIHDPRSPPVTASGAPAPAVNPAVAAGNPGGAHYAAAPAHRAPAAGQSRRSGQETSRTMMVTTVGEKFRVGKKIGEGSFGIIHEGTSLSNPETKVAVKFESRKSEAPQLRDEYRAYQILQGSPGIPRVFYFGVESSFNVLVIELLGPSLEDLFEVCSRTFSVKTVCMLAKQMLTRVRACHERGLIYRDIKPDNFLIGRNSSQEGTTVYLIDFGMAKYYRDPHTGQHIPYREKKSLSGTARYMCINTHIGREQSRRDDLEALGHVFMYFLRGALPWQGLKAQTNKQKYDKIGEKKREIRVNDLCAGYPEEFAKYLGYARNLKFDETPDYDYLLKLFNQVLKKEHLVDDQVYDWQTTARGAPRPDRNSPHPGVPPHQTSSSTAVLPGSRAHLGEDPSSGSNNAAYQSRQGSADPRAASQAGSNVYPGAGNKSGSPSSSPQGNSSSPTGESRRPGSNQNSSSRWMNPFSCFLR
ncbi:CK1/CK1/CK1-G protein kinase [Fonticula alba]|uniref:non-specific serine/threonine protein kinase n=1 Tax=Fonticula alba TaxID=691883 RepID=A0A058Z991_FONAL|nr:CK1/CK1/CK1-G protein kinase [Fonticula alba]KCV70082.1 CK1/CK1/CK1-G protein kinase [Fonticula alba]|eukprot:XP_009495688.1 CK1/CK1/CK1-G protein kinase [Fonticula alba]